MLPFHKLILAAVIHYVFVATVRADAYCEGLNHLDPCTKDSSSSSEDVERSVCVNTEQTDSTGTSCQLDCVNLCDDGQSVNQECSGPTETCQNVCDCKDHTSCQLVCKGASNEIAQKTAKKAKTNSGKAKSGKKGKGKKQ